MSKDLVRSKNYELATRQHPDTELGELETAAIRQVIGGEKLLFPLLFRLVEEDYGPEGDLSIMPSQLLAFKEELERFQKLVAARGSDETIYSFGRAKIAAQQLALLSDSLLHITQEAIRGNESLFAFAD